MRILEFVTAFFQLNILWLIFCLPVVTIFPATVAMYCVTRQWILHKDYSVFRSFFQFFKVNFKESFLLGIIWIIFAGLIFADFILLKNFGSFQYFLLPIITLLGIIIIFTTIFIFPVIANYSMNWLNYFKNSLFFSIRFFPTTLIAIIYLAMMGLIVVTWPITSLFIFSLGAYSIYSLCNRVFIKIQREKLSNK